MERHDASYSASTDEAVQPPLRWAWEKRMPLESQPVAADGKVIVISAGQVLALSEKDGSTLWRTPLPDAPARLTQFFSGWTREQRQHAPVILGRRVFVAANTTLYALELSSGQVAWREKLWEPELLDDPRFVPGRRRSRGLPFYRGGFLTVFRNRLIVGTGRDGGRVLGLDPDSGARVWRTRALASRVPRLDDVVVTLHAAVIDTAGRLYFRSAWDNIGHRRASATASWRMDAFTGGGLARTRAKPVAAGYGILLEAPGRGELVGPDRLLSSLPLTARASTSGRVRWKTTLRWTKPAGILRLETSPQSNMYAVSREMVLAAASSIEIPRDTAPNDSLFGEQVVFAVNTRTGAELWHASLRMNTPEAMDVVRAGRFVFAFDQTEGRASALTVLDAATGRLLWTGCPENGPRDRFTQGPAVAGGRIYIGTQHCLYALESADQR